MRNLFTIVLLSVFYLPVLAQNKILKNERGSKIYNTEGTSATLQRPPTPDEIWGKLFTDVQLTRALGDNKTFVDAVPKYAPSIVLQKYKSFQQSGDTSHLKDFVFRNFKVPVNPNIKLPEQTTSLKKHLEDLWPTLTRNSLILSLQEIAKVPTR